MRRIWNWHLWLGVGLILPLAWWVITALVFSLWPIETIRGNSLRGAKPGISLDLSAAPLPPAALLQGARSLHLRSVRGRALAVADRGETTEVWDLAESRSLGQAIPAEWAVEAAREDLASPPQAEAAYYLPRKGAPRRVWGQGPETLPDPAEYGGPRPAYAVHFQGSKGLHLYVDALDGQVKARRRALWRFYDLAFRLHSFEFTGDGSKRGTMMIVCLAWLGLGITGGIMAWRRLRTTRSPR